MHRCAVFHKSGRNFPGEFVLRTKDGKIFFTGQPPRFSPAAGEGSGARREIGKIGKNFPYIVKSASVWCGNFALSKRRDGEGDGRERCPCARSGSCGGNRDGRTITVMKIEGFMKKLLWIPLLLTVLTTAACGGADDGPFAPGQPSQPETPGKPGGDDDEPAEPLPGGRGRSLVLYCSRTGNTERVARQIRTVLDCDMLEVEPAVPYEDDYNAMLERAQEELAAIRQGDYPAVATYVEHFDDYDTVFVGYPIWYGSMVSPMQAFLYAHASELAGKRIALFATSGSSGVSASVGEARSLCPDAEFTEVLHLTQNTLEETEPRVTAWLERLEANDNDSEEPMQTNTLELTVEGSTFTATLEENSSTQALKERLAQGPLSIRMSDYGDMEKVGSLGISLPRNDRQTTTGPGDLILYQGDSFVIYYDTNSWNFTRLGRVDGVATREEMLDLLGGVGEITVTLSL